MQQEVHHPPVKENPKNLPQPGKKYLEADIPLPRIFVEQKQLQQKKREEDPISSSQNCKNYKYTKNEPLSRFSNFKTSHMAYFFLVFCISYRSQYLYLPIHLEFLHLKMASNIKRAFVFLIIIYLHNV